MDGWTKIEVPSKTTTMIFGPRGRGGERKWASPRGEKKVLAFVCAGPVIGQEAEED